MPPLQEISESNLQTLLEELSQWEPLADSYF